MNPELQEFLLSCLKEGKDFLISESPLVLQEFLASAVVFGILDLFISIGFGFTSAWLLKKGIAYMKGCTYHDEPVHVIYFIFGGFLGFAAVIGSYVALAKVISAYFFPRAYLLSKLLG